MCMLQPNIHRHNSLVSFVFLYSTDITSTSPPNAKGTAFSSSSSNPINDYEVDVVEIRVEEGEYADIIPSRAFPNDHPYRP